MASALKKVMAFMSTMATTAASLIGDATSEFRGFVGLNEGISFVRGFSFEPWYLQQAGFVGLDEGISYTSGFLGTDEGISQRRGFVGYG